MSASRIHGKSVDPASLPAASSAAQFLELLCDLEGVLMTHNNDLEAGKDTVNAQAQAATATVTQSASTGTSAQALAANSARIGLFLWNEDSGICYIRFGSGAAVATDFSIRLNANTGIALDGSFIPTDAMQVIWASAGSGS